MISTGEGGVGVNSFIISLRGKLNLLATRNRDNRDLLENVLASMNLIEISSYAKTRKGHLRKTGICAKFAQISFAQNRDLQLCKNAQKQGFARNLRK